MTNHTMFLRRSLQLDGVASGLTGVLLLAGGGMLAPLFGVSERAFIHMIGGGLIVFAAVLLWNAARTRPSRGVTVTAVVLNIGWVLGSAVLMVDGALTLVGNLAVAAVAGAVVLFTVLEVVGLRRLKAA